MTGPLAVSEKPSIPTHLGVCPPVGPSGSLTRDRPLSAPPSSRDPFSSPAGVNVQSPPPPPAPDAIPGAPPPGGAPPDLAPGEGKSYT